MSGFPLYDNLILQISKKDLSVKQKTEFIQLLGIIDNQGKERIYALIQFYFMENESKQVKETLPYKGVCNRAGDSGCTNVTWVLTNFPIKLRQLLYKFIKMHVKSLQEAPQRGNNEHI